MFLNIMDAKSPLYPRPFIIAMNLAVGTVLIAISAISMLTYWNTVWFLAEAVSSSIDAYGYSERGLLFVLFRIPAGGVMETRVAIVAFSVQLTLLLFIVVLVRYDFGIFALGASKLGRSLVQSTSIGEPEDVPIRYRDPAAIADWIGTKKEYRSALASQENVALFGYGIQYISPAASKAIAPIVGRLTAAARRGFRDALIPTFFGFALIGAVVSAPSWDVFRRVVPSVAQILVNIGTLDLSISLGGSYVAFLLLVGAATVLDWLFVKRLASGAKPPAEVSRRSENVQVALSPYLVGERFNQDLEGAARGDGKSDRLYRTGAEGASMSIADMGNFTIVGLIEKRPRVAAHPYFRAGVVRASTGCAYLTLGALLLTVFLLPSAAWDSLHSRELTSWKLLIDPVALCFRVAIGRTCVTRGLAMIADAERILGSYWFEAPCLRYEFNGVTSKSEVQLGAARDDSIRTKASIARSEFVAKLAASSVLAEVEGLASDREPYSLRSTSECEDLQHEVLGNLQKLARIRPSPIGLDYSGGDFMDTINANVAATAAKEQAKRSVRAQFPSKADDVRKLGRTIHEGDPEP